MSGGVERSRDAGRDGEGALVQGNGAGRAEGVVVSGDDGDVAADRGATGVEIGTAEGELVGDERIETLDTDARTGAGDPAEKLGRAGLRDVEHRVSGEEKLIQRISA